MTMSLKLVRNTEGLGRHGAIFDYEWLGGSHVEEGEVGVLESRGNFMALLFWDALIVLCMFHDPACRCRRCRPERTNE